MRAMLRLLLLLPAGVRLCLQTLRGGDWLHSCIAAWPRLKGVSARRAPHPRRQLLLLLLQRWRLGLPLLPCCRRLGLELLCCCWRRLLCH